MHSHRPSVFARCLPVFLLLVFAAAVRADQTQTVAQGTSVTISVDPDGTAPFTYQWKKEGSDVSGATNASLTLASVQLTDAGNYTVAVTNSVGTTLSDTAKVVVGTAPSISAQPTASQTVTVGANVTLSVTASGTPAVSYQWSKDGVDISGATNATLTITSATTANSGTYKVTVSNGIGSPAVSSNAVVTVNKAAQTISFGALPAKTYGDSSFSVSATATSGLTVSFTSSNPAVATVSGTTVTIVGAGTTTISANQAGNSDYLAATTAPQTLTVNKATLTVTANDVTRLYGASNPTFSTTITGFVNGDTGTSLLTQPTAATAATTTSNVGTYAITPSGGSSNNYAFTYVNGTLTITKATATVTLGGLAQTFTGTGRAATATTSPTGLATTFTYNGSATAPTNVGSYTVIGTINDTNYAGTATGTLTISQATATVTLSNLTQTETGSPLPVTVTTTPLGLPTTVTYNGSATVPSAVGTYPVVATVTDPNYTGTASGTLTINSTVPPVISSAATASGYVGVTFSYSIVASNLPTSYAATGLPAGLTLNTTSGVISGSPTTAATSTVTLTATNVAGTSTPFTLTLTIAPATAPSITTDPESQTVLAGANVTFTASASGTPSPSYQWTKNSTAIPGATNSSLTLNSVSDADAGSYAVTATNVAGSATSRSATLTVLSKPSITSQPVGASVKAGETVTFSVAARGAGTLQYQWRKDGKDISGATTASLTLPAVVRTDAGSYDVTVTNTYGSVTSNVALLAVDRVNFSGQYFGTLSGGGTWALHVDSNNNGTFIAYLSDRSTAIVTHVTIDDLGAFSTSVTELGGTSTVTTASPTHQIAAAVVPLTLTGKIAAGAIAGDINGIGESLTGTVEAGANPDAGFYQTPGLGSTSATAYSVVGGSGHALVVTSTGTGVDSASGSVDGNGVLTATTAEGAQLTLALTAATQSLSATYTPVTGPAVNFSGVSSDVTVTTRLVNLSVRSGTEPGINTLIVGFAVAGGSKSLLIRGVGPGIAAYVDGSLADPVLNLSQGNVSIAGNDDWGSDAAAIAAAGLATGAFPLGTGSTDAALLTALDSGTYTAQIDGKSRTSGVALAEIYDAVKSDAPRLVNLSARAHVGSGEKVLIGGFAIEGNAPRQYLVRAVGPALAAYGVDHPLADPQLTIQRQADNTTIATSQDWGGTAELKAAFTSVGAFPLTDDSKDAALIVTLNPGLYTAIVSGNSSTTGVALVEIYEMP